MLGKSPSNTFGHSHIQRIYICLVMVFSEVKSELIGKFLTNKKTFFYDAKNNARGYFITEFTL